jgi:hypothetical protein
MRYIRIFILHLVAAVVLVPGVTHAQFVPIQGQGIPGLDANANSIEQYINALYYLSISVAAALAVVKIIMAGMKYMLTDVVTSKADAKKDIQGALIGLLLVLGAVTILNEINPNLTKFDVLNRADKALISNKNTTTTEVVEPPGPCAINPNQQGCTTTGPITNDNIAEWQAKCGGAGVIRKNDGSYACGSIDVQPSTNYGWEVTDSNVIAELDKRCVNGRCQILFYGNTTDVDRQEETCFQQGGELSDPQRINGASYYYCAK